MNKYRKLIFVIFIVCIIIGICLGGIFLYCSNVVEKKFTGRKWSVPTTVYSDISLMYPGQKINKTLFKEKLKALLYKEVPYMPEKKGEVLFFSDKILIFLKDIDLPFFKRKGFFVKIILEGQDIVSIININKNEPVFVLEIEPEEIFRFFGNDYQQRHLISIKKVPEYFKNAVISAEDKNFYSHFGIDLKGILRAFYLNIKHLSIKQGGSTITQQLAKNFFLTHKRTYVRKIKELFLSLSIDLKYEKDEILEIYLNEIYFGQKGAVSINGVDEASVFYFGKHAKNLTLEESAVIAGLIKSPNYYSPYKNMARSKKRRDFVLQAMFSNKMITKQMLDNTVKKPVVTSGFKKYVRKAPYFSQYLAKQLSDLYTTKDLTDLGLFIYTTLDTQVQRAAEKALATGLNRLEEKNPSLKNDKQNRLQGAIIVISPKTGNILGMVGGRDYGQSQFNRVTSARLQPGSAFKPFVYLAALDKYSPSTLVSNEIEPMVIEGRLWHPKNSSKISKKSVSMREALSKSLNIATVNIAIGTGLEKIIKTAKKFKFSTPLKAYPSLALGAYEIIPLELARAYCPFAAGGILPYPVSIRKVFDSKGVLLQMRHMEINRVTSPEKAYIITSMLKSVVESGTAKSLKQKGINFPVSGKTGTTNQSNDAWFAGYTQDILALVWVGFDKKKSLFSSGASAAMPIWAELINNIPMYITKRDFPVPEGICYAKVCKKSGKIAVKGVCPDTEIEVFLKSSASLNDFCHVHKKAGFFEKIKKIFKKNRKE